MKKAVELWLDPFNDWRVLQGWRDTAKYILDRDHWKSKNSAAETSAFRLALPTEVWRMMNFDAASDHGIG